MKFTIAKEIATKKAIIKAYVREAVAAEKAGMKVETKPPEFPMPEELKEKFGNDPRFKRAFEALTPGRQRGYLISLRRREAVWDADRADREGDACDLRRTRVPGAAIDRETVDAHREIVFLRASAIGFYPLARARPRYADLDLFAKLRGSRLRPSIRGGAGPKSPELRRRRGFLIL